MFKHLELKLFSRLVILAFFFVGIVLFCIVAAVVYNPVLLHRNLRRSEVAH